MPRTFAVAAPVTMLALFRRSLTAVIVVVRSPGNVDGLSLTDRLPGVVG